MIFVLLLAVALLAGAGLALILQRDTGYVLLAWNHWTVETSLMLFVLLLIAAFLLLHWSLNLLSAFLHLRATLRHGATRLHARLARRSLTQGVLDLAEGHWAKAEHLLLKRLSHSETPLLNLLFAAKAAQMLGATERQQAHIQKALSLMPSASLAIRLEQVETLLSAGQREQALESLLTLRQDHSRHAKVLRLLTHTQLQLQRLDGLKDWLPDIRKSKALAEAELADLETQVYVSLLEQSSSNPDQLLSSFHQLPRTLQHEPKLLLRYATLLHQVGLDARAETLVAKILKEAWDADLMALYGQIEGSNPGHQLTLAESWLSEQQRNPVLLLALGRIALRAKLWGKARSYLEACLGIEYSPLAARELGRLLEAMGEKDQALNVYRQGILALPGPTPTPLPEHIGRVTKQPALDDPRVMAPPPHGARPVEE